MWNEIEADTRIEAAEYIRPRNWRPFAIFLSDKAKISNQNCYIIHSLLNRTTEGVPPELSKLSSAVHTRIVNNKTFGYDSHSGDAWDNKDTIPLCYQIAVRKMREMADKLGIGEVVCSERLKFLERYAGTGVDYWALSNIWHNP